MKDNITVYEPNQRLNIGIFKIWGTMIRNIVRSRDLISQLFKRDFFAAYKKSFLGATWIFISPIIGILSWVLMNYAGVLKPGDVGIPYPAYVLLSSSIWGLFMGFYQSSSETLNAGKGFIMQVNFPHEVLLIKQTAQHLANFLLSFALTILILLFFKVVPSWKIIFFPVAIMPLFFLGAGIGLVISVVGAVAMDLQKGFAYVMQFLMYITPVIYAPESGNSTFQFVLRWNPLTYLVCEVRNLIIYGKINEWHGFLYSSLFALIIFLISWRFFYIAEEKVIEKMI